MNIWFQPLQMLAGLFALSLIGTEVCLLPHADSLTQCGQFQQCGVDLFGQMTGMDQFTLVLSQTVSLHLFLAEGINSERQKGDQSNISYKYLKS
ncbi:hypothetical protein AAH090_11220 [Phocaeicola dorei]|nr:MULTISPECIES: hypothetical protein [Phocaeicola]